MPVVKSHKYDEIAAMKWANHTWQRLKKTKELGIPLIFWDESGFSLSPIRGTTWCEIGSDPKLLHAFFQHAKLKL